MNIRIGIAIAAAATIAATMIGAGQAAARDQVEIARSSTALPYTNIVAEAFGETYPEFKTPIVESGGSSAGLKEFCKGVGPDFAFTPADWFKALGAEVLLMDEPCSALDPIATARIEELIDELRKNLAIVIVTHAMQQAARVSQQTAFFHLGVMAEFGETAMIFTNPDDKRTQDYITGRFG